VSMQKQRTVTFDFIDVVNVKLLCCVAILDQDIAHPHLQRSYS